MTNQYGIDISYELGHKINKALYQGDTRLLFALISSYLEKNQLEIPKTRELKAQLKKFYEDEEGVLLR
ncbi:MAG TPA: hypothetical protein ENJ55_03150 [Rhizobiales bacterium]|nr:hypothetical protein [Hyphomicrobiales bacterium]